MNKALFFMVCLLSFAYSCSSLAADGWLLLFDNRNHLLARASDAGVEPAVTLGNYTLYGSTDSNVAALSFDTNSQQGKLVVIQKATGKILHDWPITSFPATQMSGPSSDLVLVQDQAYFVSIRWGRGDTIVPNDLGGMFDLNRISLADGHVDSIALPKELRAPRPALVVGRIMVSDGVAERTWCVDFERGSVRKIATIPSLSGAQLPWVREGGISGLLDELTRASPINGREEAAGSRAEILRVLPLSRNDGFAMAVLSKHEGRLSLLELDQHRDKIDREIDLPADVVPGTVQRLPDGNTVYVVLSSKSVQLTSADGSTRTLWTLDNQSPGAFHEVRILAVSE
jgi:hypothetical protein